ncbi:hypothetical protein [Hyalangium rubrum]|uniref:Glycerophosphoryl diester phosphodiesterase membrane domain-containing protein n=1 Tax=Hyalangium rubrum TaxID=3103134 RepID=A0ABU5HB71_9BACT|nr:hypothetical protein [Hyalangium sp. s54d21]MDY7230720.1 hypothetical protein [Hyalangium sp. s54d21]
MNAPGIKDLRPLALGELIDRSATFWRAHIKPLFLLCFGFELINYILSKSVVVALERGNLFFKGGPELQSRMENDPTSLFGDLGTMMGATSVLWVVLIWSYWLSTLVVARYVVPVQLGESALPADGLRRGLHRLGSFTGAYVLTQLWGLGISLLMMLPGGALILLGALLSQTGSNSRPATIAGLLLIAGGALLAMLGGLAALFWYFLRFSLLAPVFAMEDLSTLGSFRRSGDLISGRVAPGFMGRVKVRAMILFTVVAGILIAVSFVSGLPAWIVRFAYGNPFDAAAAAANPIPQTLLVPVELLQVVGQSFFTPLALVFSAMFYLDMRMRREGLDLERRLDNRPPTSA